MTRVDEDLSAMYLSARAAGRPRALHDHEQLEILLESFVKQVEEIVSEIDTTVVRTQYITPFPIAHSRRQISTRHKRSPN